MVAGVTFANGNGTRRQTIIRRDVHRAMKLRLAHEANNPGDSQAVAVFTPGGMQIGYLKRFLNCDVLEWLEKGLQVEIIAADLRPSPDGEIWGVLIHVYVFDPRPPAPPPEPKKPKVPKPRSKKAQPIAPPDIAA